MILLKTLNLVPEGNVLLSNSRSRCKRIRKALSSWLWFVVKRSSEKSKLFSSIVALGTNKLEARPVETELLLVKRNERRIESLMKWKLSVLNSEEKKTSIKTFFRFVWSNRSLTNFQDERLTVTLKNDEQLICPSVQPCWNNHRSNKFKTKTNRNIQLKRSTNHCALFRRIRIDETLPQPTCTEPFNNLS